MVGASRAIEWREMGIAIPAFMTITLVPFTYSIHNGIIAGILMDLLLNWLSRLGMFASSRFKRPEGGEGELVPQQKLTPSSASGRLALSSPSPHAIRRLSTPSAPSPHMSAAAVNPDDKV